MRHRASTVLWPRQPAKPRAPSALRSVALTSGTRQSHLKQHDRPAMTRQFSRLPAASAAGYLLGTIPSADLATRLANTDVSDLRSAGSGNPGAINAADVLGVRWGLAVLAADMSKGAIAGGLGQGIAGPATWCRSGNRVVGVKAWRPRPAPASSSFQHSFQSMPSSHSSAPPDYVTPSTRQACPVQLGLWRACSGGGDTSPTHGAHPPVQAPWHSRYLVQR